MKTIVKILEQIGRKSAGFASYATLYQPDFRKVKQEKMKTETKGKV